MLCGMAFADTVYVDARTGSNLTTGVTDSGFSNSTAACGSVATRYGSSSSTWTQVKPTLGVAGGYYDVQVCHSGNTYGNISGDILANITLTNATAITGDVKDLGYTDKWQGGASPYHYQDCTYYSVGVIKLDAGVTVPTVKFAYGGGTVSGTSRWNVRGWCFTQVTPRTLTVSASPSGGGTVTGAGNYVSGVSVTVTATDNTGYRFEKWTDGSGAQVSTSPSYTFNMPDSAYTLIAVYHATSERFLTLVDIPSGQAISLSGAGYYEPGSLISPTAIANVGYTFSKWSTNALGTDTVTLPYVMPSANATLFAIFTQNHYSLTRTACSGGTVTGSTGSFTMGSAVTVNAVPDPGYCFVGWTTDGCGGTAFARGGSTYSFNMPPNDVALSAVFGKAKFIESFESYVTGGVSIDSLCKNDSVGPNQSSNGSGNPWWGSNPPNGRVNPCNAHFGSQSMRGTAGNCRDFYNLQYRLNSGTPFSGNVYLDWWFYDPLGPGGSTVNFCGDYTALSYFSGIPIGADYPSPVPDPMGGMVQQIAIGMSDDLSTGYDPTKYQVRIQGDVAGYHNGWSNTSATRSVGWHHARIVVGPKKVSNTNDISFYVDNMSVASIGPLDSVTINGYNIIDVNTMMPVAGSPASPNGCQYSKYFHFSAVDDISFGALPNLPGSSAAGPLGTSQITWNWLDNSNGEDGCEIWDSQTGGVLKTSANAGGTSATENGLTANTRYSRWVDASLAQYCGTIASQRAALTPTYTLATPPVYGASGDAAISCNNGQSATCLVSTPITFTAINGFGTGQAKASKYLYIWNTSAGNPGNWSGASQWTSAVLTMTPNAAGAYYLHLRACNGDWVANTTNLNLGPYIYLAPIAVDRISDAWAYDDGQVLQLTSKAVTAAFSNSSLWIEEADRTAGMNVIYPATNSAWLDHAVTITGVLDSTMKPRSFVASIVEDKGTASPKITPLEMVLQSIGGADFNAKTLGITGGVGRYNIGLLARVAGKVSFCDNTSDPNNKYFNIDDGSAVTSNGHQGTKVKCGTLNAPTSGTVKVTGVISIEQSGASYVPVLITRNADDVVPL